VRAQAALWRVIHKLSSSLFNPCLGYGVHLVDGGKSLDWFLDPEVIRAEERVFHAKKPRETKATKKSAA
jgi:hypothetical protein